MGLRGLIVIVALSGAAFAPACVAPVEHDSIHAHARCAVCQCHGDLACVDVTIDANTPRVARDGKTFYFCSEECRCDFERAPQLYEAAAK